MEKDHVNSPYKKLPQELPQKDVFLVTLGVSKLERHFNSERITYNIRFLIFFLSSKITKMKCNVHIILANLRISKAKTFQTVFVKLD